MKIERGLLCGAVLLLASGVWAHGPDSGVKLLGKIEALPPAPFTGTWTVAGRIVNVSTGTKLEFEAGSLVAGTCVEVRGESGANNSVNASKIETLPANRCEPKPLRSDVEIFGSIQQLPASGLVGDWRVGTTIVHVTAQTEVEQNGGPIAIGSCAEVEGTRNSDGSLNANEIEVRSGIAGCSASLPDDRPEIKFRGTAQMAPTGGVGIWVISGRRVQVAADTRIEPRRDSLSVGDCVDVEGRLLGDGSVLPSEIHILGAGACRDTQGRRADLRFFGNVQTQPASGFTGDWRIGNETVRVTSDTRIVTERGPLGVGACVEVSGDIQGALIAALRIEVREARDCGQQAGGVFVFTATVETAPAAGNIGTWMIGGRSVITSASTVFDTSKGNLLVGACVTVTGTLQVEAVNATRLEVLSASGACILPGGIVSGGNLSGTGVVAGEIVSIFGRNIGPATSLPLLIAANRVTSRLGNTRVLFDGVEATLLLVSEGQINAIVPCSIAGKQTVRVQVESNGVWSNVVTLPVLAAAPSLFTLAASGTGPGAILNFDAAAGFTLNSAGNPAARGAVVLLFATGIGATNPACSDGLIVPLAGPFPRPVLPVTVEIGGRPAAVQFAGGAPGLVSGLIQINAVVPSDAPVGPNVPVVVRAGTAASQTGVTLSVK